jgi:hypothetical protein
MVPAGIVNKSPVARSPLQVSSHFCGGGGFRARKNKTRNTT